MSSQLVMSEPEALELLAYLLSCADTCRREPTLYGPVRLLKAASRLAAIVKGLTVGDVHDFWQRTCDEIELKADWHIYEMHSWNEFVSQMPVCVALELKRRVALREAGQ